MRSSGITGLKPIATEIVRRIKADDPSNPNQAISIEYALALQIIVLALGEDIVEALQEFLPKSTRSSTTLRQDIQRHPHGWIRAMVHHGGIGKAANIARLIAFASYLLDLEDGSVINFARVKRHCNAAGLKKRPFEHTFYEIVIASRMARRKLRVAFIDEEANKTPDFIISDGKTSIVAECKSNRYQNLDVVSEQNIRIKRAHDRLIDGCAQLDEYCRGKRLDGCVFVNYLDNRFLSTDKEIMRTQLKKEIGKHPQVLGALFSYEKLDMSRVRWQMPAFGAIKDLWYQRMWRGLKGYGPLTRTMINALTFHESVTLSSLHDRLMAS